MEVGFPEFFLSSGENYFANKCNALGALRIQMPRSHSRWFN